MTCDYAELDGSYVLGSLSPARAAGLRAPPRRPATTARASVRELAGLPGLLARVDPVILEPAPAVEPVPATLLPSLVREVGRSRRRHLFATVGVAAAAVVAVAATALTSLGGDTPPVAGPPTSPSPSQTTSPAAPVGMSMIPVGEAPVTATLAFTPVGWGTKLDLTCTYRPENVGYNLPKATTYVLYVVHRDGSSEAVGTWRALDGRTMHFSAGTSEQLRKIATVEVRTQRGQPVLRLKS